MSARNRMAATAELLAEGQYQPDEITILAIVDREVRRLVNAAVYFELVAMNLDRPNADKYGSNRDGSPRYAPEWYVAQGISTGIHEGLYVTLRNVLSCEEVDDEGHRCIGSILHETCHWDGNGNNWSTP